jgi:serine/threonine-protein kinase
VQIAEALVAAHRFGLVHRDIKPANILLDDGGHRVLLSDFGLARTIDDASLTNSGMVAGTPQYMSPEQARGMSIDHRSDLYSLGAVLYAMATGRPPVRGDSTLAVLRRVGEDKPIPVYEINETMPLWLDRLIQLFLEKKVESRIANASDAVELLRSSLAHARAPVRNPLVKELQSPTRSSLPRRILAVGVLAAMLVVGSIFWPTKPSSENAISIPRQEIRSSNNAPESRFIPTDDLIFDSDMSKRLDELESTMKEIRASIPK